MDSKDCLQGDLNDIIRASYGNCISSTVGTRSSDHHWMFLSDPMDFSCVFEQDHPRSCSFGDPFSNMRDPFLHQLDMSGEFRGGGVLEDAACFGDVAVIGRGDNSNNNNNNCVLAKENIIVAEDDDMMLRRPSYCNNIILSNMIQISPKANGKLPIISSTYSSGDSPKIVKTSTSAVISVAGNTINAASNSNNKADHGLLELEEHKTGAAAGLQISSPRNNPAAGLKHRRKCQAKKSICIPAPTAPNSRQSGEIVPSDLWAWRKYGQKPIKGSPYPRGYYRCSSSKGCPARKQVERSRTDPNMLVITYTSEHNHPWPTQRNALAGSSRSQPSKNNIINSASASKNNNFSAEITDDELHKGPTTNLPQEEEQESNTSTEGNNNYNDTSVKEEIDDGMMEKLQLEMDVDDDDGRFRNGSSVVPYKNNNKQLLEELFAKLGEMEADDAYDDSMKGLINNNYNAVDHQQIRESKGLDSFHVFGWSGENSITRYHLI